MTDVESHWMDGKEGDFTKEELLGMHEDLSDLESCLQLNAAVGVIYSSAIEAIHEVQEVIEQLVKGL